VNKQKARHVCFEQLQVGGSIGVFQQAHRGHNRGREALFRGFRDNVLRYHGIDPMSTPKKHKIVLVRKTSFTFKRDIKNLDEVAEFLKKAYPDIESTIVDFSTMTVPEQLKLLMSTTILITPCGGVSATLPFLPEGSHAIITDFYVSKTQYGFTEGESGSMEGGLWNHWAHFTKDYYQVREKGVDYELEGDDVTDTRWYASTIIRLDRIKDMIDGALEDMEA
jgi:hypothetical protein